MCVRISVGAGAFGVSGASGFAVHLSIPLMHWQLMLGRGSEEAPSVWGMDSGGIGACRFVLKLGLRDPSMDGMTIGLQVLC